MGAVVLLPVFSTDTVSRTGLEVEATTHPLNLSGEFVRTVRRGKIRANGVGASAGLADLGDDGFSLVRSAAVMNHNLRTCRGEGQRGGAANAAPGAGDERGLS